MLRLDPGQHRHLRPALDLEDPQRVRACWIIAVGLRKSSAGMVASSRATTLVLAQKVETASSCSSACPGPGTSTFMNFRASMSSLSHSMT